MKLPARFFLAVVTLSIGTLTPIVAPPISLARFERLRLLREDGRRQVSQLPDEHDRDDFNFWVVMLHDSVDMLRTIFYESDAILFTDAVNRNGWR